MNYLSCCFYYFVLFHLFKSVYLNLMHKTDSNAIATNPGYSLFVFLFLYLQNLKYLKWVRNDQYLSLLSKGFDIFTQNIDVNSNK